MHLVLHLFPTILVVLTQRSGAFLHLQVAEQLMMDDEAIRQLGQVFDMPTFNEPRSRDVRDDNFNRSSRYHASKDQLVPSPYMLNLYNTIADNNGVMRIPNPYNANIIRSFQNKDLSENGHMLFDLSTINIAERILQAELHLQILAIVPSWQQADNILITLYQVYMVNKRPQRKRLVSRLVQLQVRNQTQVFPVRSAALEWIRNSADNEGLEVVVSADEKQVATTSAPQYSLAKKTANPTLILFLDDGRQKQNSKYRIKNPSKQTAYLRSRLRRLGQEELLSSFDWAFQPKYHLSNMSSRISLEQVLQVSGTSSRVRLRRNSNDHLHRSRRKAGKSQRKKKYYHQRRKQNNKIRGPCRRHELFVNFEEIGWSSWIISPKGFQAFHCRGDCHFPIGQESKPSNHATVISIINHMKLRKRVAPPCCVPEKLYSISLLYFDNEQNVVLKQYDDMVAQSCACR